MLAWPEPIWGDTAVASTGQCRVRLRRRLSKRHAQGQILLSRLCVTERGAPAEIHARGLACQTMRLLHIGARARWKGVSCVIILHKRNESRGNEDTHAAGLRRQPGGGATRAHPWRRSTTHRRGRHPSPGGSAAPCPAATLRPAAAPRLALPRQLASPRGRATFQARAAAARRHHRACRLGWRRRYASAGGRAISRPAALVPRGRGLACSR